MPRFDAEYSPPKNTAAAISDGARAAFQNQEAEQLFAGLGLRAGGFQANANRVFTLDDAGNLVPAPPYNANDDHGMTAAAQDGRLYVRGKDNRLRQVRLEGNENDGFAFVATSFLQREQMPPRSFAYRISYLKSLVSDMSQAWTDMKNDMARIHTKWKQDMAQIWTDMKQDMSKFWSDMKEDWANIRKGEFNPWDRIKKDWAYISSRRNKKAEPAEAKVEDEPVQTQQTVSTPKEEQIQQPTQPDVNKEKTVAELLETNPTKQTTPEFEKYLTALSDRRNEKPVEQALEKENGKPADYYEALAQELEGSVADKILSVAPKKESDPVGREKFLHDQKPVMASMSKGLRDFVQEKVDPKPVNDYYAARAGGAADLHVETMKMKLQNEANALSGTGVDDYTKGVLAQNEAIKQEQQSQLSQAQVKQAQMQQEQAQMQPPELKPPQLPPM